MWKKLVKTVRPEFPEDGPPLPAGLGIRWPFAPKYITEEKKLGLLRWGGAVVEKMAVGEEITYMGFKFILRDIADKMGIKEYWWE